MGIEVRSGFWPLINTKNIKSVYVGNAKISENCYKKLLVLPSNFLLKERDIIFVKNQIIKLTKEIKQKYENYK